jgi:CubicO group peptidase (beta-lactamase class C family)
VTTGRPSVRATGGLAGRLFASLLVLLPGAGAQAADPASHGPDIASLEAAFDDAFARYDPPGLAVGVVVDGEVVFERTRGELVAGSGQAIDRDTLFKIASNSKAMTAALLARLVDQGRLRWTDPVVKHLPDFRMHDDWVTREIQARDLLIHNSGLGAGAGDLMLWPEPNGFTREDVIRGLRHLKPAYSFRSRYAYDNTLYIVAGEVAAAAGGAPFDQLIRRELFAPLGMTRCQAGAWRRDAVGNIAQPHMRADDGTQVVVRGDDALVADVPMMAAGGIRCSLADMLRWAAVWLQPERHGLDASGRPWLSRAQREEVWKNHMPMPLSARMREWDGSHFSAYGYGWRLTDVDGTWKVSHTGTLSGMYSSLTLLPHRGVGIVILANGNAEELRTVLGQVLVKRFTRPQDTSLTVAHYASLLAAERDAAPADAPDAPADSRSEAVPGDRALVQGRYVDPWFGEVRLCAAGQAVEFRALKSPKLHGRVMRVDDRLLVDWHDPEVDAEAWLEFSDSQGPVRMTMAKVDPEADFSYDYEDLAFERVGDCASD